MIRIFASLLLLLPLTRLTQLNSSPVTLTPSQLHYMVKERIETYRHQKPGGTKSHQTHELGSDTPSRQLQPSSIGRKLLIHAEYQLSTLEPKSAAYIQSIVEAAIQTIQSYLSLNTTTPPGPLLIPPIYYSPQDCDRTNYYYPLTGSTCFSPGYSPAFNETLTRNDIRAPYCGPALLNKSNFLDPSCLNGECQKSVTGGLGVQTDYYLYITADVTPGICYVGSTVSGAAAYTLTCFQDNSATFRPILSAVNICPAAFKTYTSSARLASLVVHEILHALGFQDTFFYAFRGANGDASKIAQRIPADSSLQAAGIRNNYLMMISPTVVREARAQFGCPTLQGAPLEDGGGLGSEGGHWEDELFQGERLTPTETSDASPSRISRMTLAFFEDSGWYIGNWSIAPYLDWGRNQGCDFVQLTSNAYAAKYPEQPYFCTPTIKSTIQLSDSICSFNGLSHGYCLKSAFSTMGLITSFSSSNASTGIMSLGSFCISPLFYSNTVGDSSFNALATASLGWTMGPSARCMLTQGLVMGSIIIPSTFPTCMKATCDSTGSTLTYYLANNDRVTCQDGAGGNVSLVDASGGKIHGGLSICPKSVRLYCMTLACPSSTSPCSSAEGGGLCFEGTCVCNFGFSGPNCETRFLPPDFAIPSSFLVPAAPPPPPKSPSSSPSSPDPPPPAKTKRPPPPNKSPPPFKKPPPPKKHPPPFKKPPPPKKRPPPFKKRPPPFKRQPPPRA